MQQKSWHQPFVCAIDYGYSFYGYLFVCCKTGIHRPHSPGYPVGGSVCAEMRLSYVLSINFSYSFSECPGPSFTRSMLDNSDLTHTHPFDPAVRRSVIYQHRKETLPWTDRAQNWYACTYLAYFRLLESAWNKLSNLEYFHRIGIKSYIFQLWAVLYVGIAWVQCNFVYTRTGFAEWAHVHVA